MLRKVAEYTLAIDLIALAVILIGGCTSDFMADLDLEQRVEEEVLKKMSPSEAAFVRSILMYPEPGTKGSIRWLEQHVFEDFMPREYTRQISNVVLVAFYYPSARFPYADEPAVLFANADLVQDINSTNEFVEWITIARLTGERYKSVKASCKFMFWFINTMEKNRSEKFLEVSEEFELKDNQWQLSKVKTYPSRLN